MEGPSKAGDTVWAEEAGKLVGFHVDGGRVRISFGDVDSGEELTRSIGIWRFRRLVKAIEEALAGRDLIEDQKCS